MATEHDGRSHNQPSHEAQVKGGQHSHSGSQHGSEETSSGQHTQGSDNRGGASRKTNDGAEDGRSHNQPSHEAQVKGGQHSRSGSEKK
jgi:hypothetical protein